MGRWREMDPAELEEAYSPSSCIGGDYSSHLVEYAERSAEARMSVPGWRELSYGPAPAQRLDLFPVAGGGPAPLLVFVHGGYWQELSKEDSAFAAPSWVAEGVAFAALGYTLAPEASLREIVGECRRALAWLHGHAPELGVDQDRIVLAGSSAGAHLAAMAAVPGWQRGVGLPEGAVAGTALFSGVYDLEPLQGTCIAEPLCLTHDDVACLSPVRADLAGFPRSLVCWGEVETGEFKYQSRGFAGLLDSVGTGCEALEVAGRNHFDVVMDLVDPGTEVWRRVASLIG